MRFAKVGNMFKETDRRSSRHKQLLFLMVMWATVACGAAFGQAPSGQGGPPPAGAQDGNFGNGPGDHMGPPPMERRRPPMEQALHVGPRGRWWNDPGFVKMLSLTSDQQKKMEDVFQQSRPALMDLSSQVRAEEEKMRPLLAVDQPDEGKVLAEIDRVAQIRAELEKANARMLLGLRRVLTQDQWKKLQANDPSRHFGDHGPHHNEPEPN
jgi:Spy/CpxP family protein refolding chaperone